MNASPLFIEFVARQKHADLDALIRRAQADEAFGTAPRSIRAAWAALLTGIAIRLDASAASRAFGDVSTCGKSS